MIRLGVPSKGRLMEAAFDWFATRGLTLSRAGSDRDYTGRAEGIEGVGLTLLSAGEIPRELAAGRIHLGVTGTDLICEKLAGWRSLVAEVAPMGFGHADLVLAVPDAWHDCRNLEDFAEIATQFRQNHGQRLRIATKYHRLMRSYLTAHEVSDYALTDSQGATEGTVANLTAEAVADITSSGATLRANHLRVLEGPPVLRSQATLWRSLTAPQDGIDAVIAALGL